MRPIHTLSVSTRFSSPFERLDELLRNVHWTWDQKTIDLFRQIDPVLWERTNHSPLRLLAELGEERLGRLAEDEAFMQEYREALGRLDAYVGSQGWYHREYTQSGSESGETIAYFSAEFGIHESLPLYSGGLGVLSGDHTKSASDLGLPMVGVGLLYQMGYFHQRITHEGLQLESYERNDPSFLPITRIRDEEGRGVTVTVETPVGTITVGVWRMQVGRIPLYLLDTNLPANTEPTLRNITGYLYGGDLEMRILQEIVLGIGGMRMLERLGIEPDVTHCNEGHSAFLLLERARRSMKEFGLTFEEACRLSAAGSVFTTHTPVPAGHDVFDRGLIERYLAGYVAELGIDFDRFMELGRTDAAEPDAGFSMTVLALKLSSGRNGVSRLHGEVSRTMWQDVWPEVPRGETPIRGLTNGVHTDTFISRHMAELYDRWVAPDWRERIPDLEMWSRAAEIPDEELVRRSDRMREEMILGLRARLMERRSDTFSRGEAGRRIERVLDPAVLTIGFARRFATYKRATLLLRDRERALRLFGDEERPIQLVLAGKAHPRDAAGKEFIREIISFVIDAGLQHRILFLEDYDIGVARSMVQGCDVWLNTPRRPMEASGTSGMKAALNGTLNLSVLDGWFPEAYDGTNGWAIGDERSFADPEYQDEIESRHLYRVLEEEVIPSFYGNRSGEEEAWTAQQKRTIATMAGAFSSHRMVQDYTRTLYRPALDRHRRLVANRAEGARNLEAWIDHLRGIWEDIRFEEVTVTPPQTEMATGDRLEIDVRLHTGRVAPGNVRVEALVGPQDAGGEIVDGVLVRLERTGEETDRGYYTGSLPLEEPGRTAIAVRAVPAHDDLISTPDVRLVTWT